MEIKEIIGNGNLTITAVPKYESLPAIIHFKNIVGMGKTKDGQWFFQVTKQKSDRSYLNSAWYTLTRTKKGSE